MLSLKKDLSTALSGLNQDEIAKIKSVLDRDQERDPKLRYKRLFWYVNWI